ncbi:MAG: alpha/beta hydrolase [bacterium]|nr:alpha/beta hydrolase [bacterium]
MGLFFVVMEEGECEGYKGKAITTSFISAEVDDTFKIVVYLPKDYERKNKSSEKSLQEKRYPVIYQLDGNYQGKLTAIMAARFSCEGSIPSEAIVVSIGYYFYGWGNKRVRDYTYPAPGGGSSGYWTFEGSGGGLKFYNFLKNELVPYVDKHYRTDNTNGRTLIGHSVGGYFTLFAMFYGYMQDIKEPEKPGEPGKPAKTAKTAKPITRLESPQKWKRSMNSEPTGNHNSSPGGLFRNYIAASPTILYCHEYLFFLEDYFMANSSNTIRVNLYMTMSDREEVTPVKYFPLLAEQLEKKRSDMRGATGTATPGGFRFKNRMFKGLKHQETVVPTYEAGLKFVLAPGKHFQ